MDKGIRTAVILAAIVSIGAALLWDKVVTLPTNKFIEKSEKEIQPNRETIEYQIVKGVSKNIIESPNKDSKVNRSPKPRKKPKPTAYKPGKSKENVKVENSDAEKGKVITHVVKKNDSLSRISKKYYKTEKYWMMLQKFNNLKTTKLSIRQKNLVPAKPKK